MKDEKSIEFAALDEFLCVLRESTENRLRKSLPDLDNVKLDKLAKVDSFECGRYLWVSVNDVIRFAVRIKDGSIFLVEKDAVRHNHKYGSLLRHEEWDWEHYYPRKKVWHGWEEEERARAERAAANLRREAAKAARRIDPKQARRTGRGVRADHQDMGNEGHPARERKPSVRQHENGGPEDVPGNPETHQG